MNRFLILLVLITCFQKTLCQSDAVHSALSFTTREISRVSINSFYTYQFTAIDSSSKPVHFFVTQLPGWLTYNDADHSISGKPAKAGQYPISISVSNGTDTAYQQFMLTVFDRQTINILCLGNSITNGTSAYNSYRRALWQILHNENYNFDLIGSWDKHHMGGEVPDPDFDMDHEGHSGWNFENIFHSPDWDSARGNIYTWLQTYTPDMVLLELGTNDVFQCRKVPDILNNFSELVEVLRKKNSTVKIFAAQIPPLGAQWAQKKLCGNDSTYDQMIQSLNKAIAIFAHNNTTTESPIIVVDQYSGIDPATEMFDDIHPNEKGEKIMAVKWYAAIHQDLKKLK